MTTLANFPMKNQLTEKSSDGTVVQNPNYDCVPVSFAAAIQYYDGGYISGDELIDYAYGFTKTGGTAMKDYVDQTSDRARALYHVTALAENDTNPMNLVKAIHAAVDGGFPVIATIPSAWNSTAAALGVTNRCDPNISSHVVVFYSTGNGTLTAMNPWFGGPHEGGDQYWADRLLFCQIWKVQKEENVTLQIGDVAQYGFTADSAGWHAGGFLVHGGILAAFQALPFAQTGKPLTNEIAFLTGYNGTFQVFERAVLYFDPQRKNDAPPKVVLGDVYVGHIEKGPAHDWLVSTAVAPLNAQIKSLNDQITTLKANPPSGITSAGEAALQKVQSDLASMSSEITDAVAQAKLIK